MKQAIQYTDTVKSETDAQQMLAWLATQTDYIGGRVLIPTAIHLSWRIQAFFDDVPTPSELLPTGCRHVVLLPNRWPL